MPRKSTIPAYRLHAASGQARVIIDGKHIYLGRYGSEESKAEYEQIVRKLLTRPRRDRDEGARRDLDRPAHRRARRALT